MLKLNLICILIISATSVLAKEELKCYTCNDAEKGCKDITDATLESCSGTCTTIFVKETPDKETPDKETPDKETPDKETSYKDTSEKETPDKVIRGCSTELTTECTNSEDKCFQCKSNSCNIAQEITDYIDCIDCNSKTEINCLHGTNIKTTKCNKNCMAQMVLDDTTKFYNLIRTCLDDLEIPQQEKCDGKMCKSCTDATGNCNKDILPDNFLQCQTCDGVEKCMNPVTKACEKYNDDDKCFAIYSKSNIESLGCVSSNVTLTSDKIDELTGKNLIYLCDGNDCNKLEKLPKKQECSLCNSKTDPNCLKIQNEKESKTMCNVEKDFGCYVRILPDKSTDRGCWKNLPENDKLNCTDKTGNKLCLPCADDLCNNKIFPENRRQCHVCDSSIHSPCSTNDPKKEEVCLLYDENDQCVSILDNKITYRGCQSNINRECNELDKNCFKCKNNNCNIVDFNNIINDSGNSGMWQDLPLTCLTCNGDSCKNNQFVNESCDNNLSDCMTVFNEESVVIARGCENKVYESYFEYCHRNPKLCFNCKSNNCNNAINVNDFITCTYCGWPNGPSCNEIDSSSTTIYAKRQCNKSCMTALYNHFDDTEEPAYNLIRTCTDDKPAEQQTNCTTSIDDENSLCLTCTDANCNKETYPKNRSNCFMCDSEKGCETPNSQKCPLHRNNDDCYYIYNNAQIVEKSGCKSSLKKSVIEDLMNKNKIGLCNGKDCNSVEKQPKNNECLICDSKTNIECATKSNQINITTTCPAPNSKCFVKVDKDGFTQRGCLVTLESEMSKCNSTSNTCKSCGDAEKCNNENFPENRRSCIVCNSTLDKKCHNNPDSHQICPQYLPDEKCVSIYKKKETIRGCGQLVKCDESSNNKTCEICDTNDCNKVNLQKLNNSGATIFGNIMIISLLSFGLIIFFK